MNNLSNNHEQNNNSTQESRNLTPLILDYLNERVPPDSFNKPESPLDILQRKLGTILFGGAGGDPICIIGDRRLAVFRRVLIKAAGHWIVPLNNPFTSDLGMRHPKAIERLRSARMILIDLKPYHCKVRTPANLRFINNAASARKSEQDTPLRFEACPVIFATDGINKLERLIASTYKPENIIELFSQRNSASEAAEVLKAASTSHQLYLLMEWLLEGSILEYEVLHGVKPPISN